MAETSEEVRDELEALEAIWSGGGEAIFSRKEAAWGTSGGTSFCVSLSGKVAITFLLASTYPKSAAQVTLAAIPPPSVKPSPLLASSAAAAQKQAQVVSDVLLRQLRGELEALANTLKGNVMCHELLVHANDFLNVHVMSKLKDQAPKDLFEAMHEREKREAAVLLSIRDGEGKSIDIDASLLAENSETEKTSSINKRRASSGDAVVSPTDLAAAASSSSWLLKALTQGADGEEEEEEELDGGTGGGSGEAEDDEDDEEEEEEEEEEDESKDLTNEDDTQGGGNRTTGTAAAAAAAAAAGASRYSKDFEELDDQPLGRGASGSVWKVKNRFDKRLYAVKKIGIRKITPRIKQEVSTLVKLRVCDWPSCALPLALFPSLIHPHSRSHTHLHSHTHTHTHTLERLYAQTHSSLLRSLGRGMQRQVRTSEKSR